jgi:hypothetical protein
VTSLVRFALLTGAALAGVFVAETASACAGAGIVTRIDGRPQDIVISRAGATVPRPRVLEVVCQGDIVRVSGATKATLSVDGQGKVTVDGARPYTVPQRRGAPSVAGNAYRSVSDKVVPDMKRLPWDVRLKGSGTGFEFALPALASGQQKLQAGRRDLLVRLAGGDGPFRVDLTTESGASVATASGGDPDLVLRGVTLAPGTYKLKASDSSANGVEARLVVSAEGPPADTTFADLPDAEVRAAVRAVELAKAHPDVWSFEAVQLLSAAPGRGPWTGRASTCCSRASTSPPTRAEPRPSARLGRRPTGPRRRRR